MRKLIACAACAVVACAFMVALSAAPGPAVPPSVRQAETLARETLDPNDGWAAYSTGTTGGAAADADHVYVVSNRSEFKAATAAIAGDPPRIIIVVGTIDANVDDTNQPLGCSDYAAGTGYTLEAYLAAFDPAVVGRTKVPSGPLETARKASQGKQQKQIRLQVPSNTTIVGAGNGSGFVGANIFVANADNVIIRNLTFTDAFDCFPQWDPTDGTYGNWNSQYDLVSIDRAKNAAGTYVPGTHVWVDHCLFTDGDRPDGDQPKYFGRTWQQHDGALDITNGSDLVTVSWNHFTNHDKTMLIGSSDSSTSDPGKLDVTIHHNFFDRVIQRLPRVRFGKVHVYNNYYLVDDAFSYAWGVGIASRIFAENNFFEVEGSTTPDEFIDWYKKPTSALEVLDIGIYVGETLVNGPAIKDHVDVLNEYNAENPTKQLLPTVNWWPTLHGPMHPTSAVPALVTAKAGPFLTNEQ